MNIVAKIVMLGTVLNLVRASFFREREEAGQDPAPIRCEVAYRCCDACPLSSLGVGQACSLQGSTVGRRLRRRLAELGLTPGVEMTVLQNSGGPVLICVRNSRLALGRQMAHKLDVLPLPMEDVAR